MKDFPLPVWQHIGAIALREADPHLIRQRVLDAETAIFLRLQNLTRTPENFELEAMDAMLAELQRHVSHSAGVGNLKTRAAGRH